MREEDILETKFKLRDLEREKDFLAAEVKRLREENERFRHILEMTKREIALLREEVGKLKAPPLPYGTFIGLSPDPELVQIAVDGKIYEVKIANEKIKREDLKPGQKVLLNPAFNIVDLRDDFAVGEVAKVVNLLDEDRVIIRSRDTEERVVKLSSSLLAKKPRIGDNVRFDPKTELIFEVLPKSEVEEVVLEEIPEVTYEDIGGLAPQIEQLKDAVELPYIYGHLYSQFKLKPPKGILLYGPPGCGKTMLAKAVANSLSRRIRRFLEENKEAILIYKELKKGKKGRDILMRFENLCSQIYDYRAIYKNPPEGDTEALYQKLDESGILERFIRRMAARKGKKSELVWDITDWYNLLIELKEKGFGACLDRVRIGEMLERKRKEYLLSRKEMSDEDYAIHWLEEYLRTNKIDLNNLDEELKKTEEKLGTGIKSYFLNIKGPELLNKYVGETEYRIREVFQRAKERASYGLPVIVFFDEMESLFRIRGSGISSDIESTIVPQFLAEIDGVESIENVIVIGASNRQDLIDPAVLRVGRLDVKIRIDRPDKEAAKEIFGKYLTPDLPFASEELAHFGGDPEKLVSHLIDVAVEEMYSTKKEKQFLRVTYQNKEQEILYFKDFSSGAMIEAIVSRAKTYALKRLIQTGKKGIRKEDILQAIRDEYKENEDLPNTTNPDDWTKIAGRKGERIIAVESLLPGRLRKEQKEVEEIRVDSRYL
ncbi:MAG: AAA family ATPase [Acidobacteria bacterium]|nr:AAA family ATPase [Acidobacteriota bacterium]